MTAVTLSPVDTTNWRAVAAVQVRPDQQDFVAPVCYYLALCYYGGLWRPMVIESEDSIVGFVMWAVDPEDGSHWIGGLSIDAGHQNKGLGRAAVQELLAFLRGQPDFYRAGLSYDPSNPARELYRSLGFVETGEDEDGEVVARWRPGAGS